jgi:site-specific DNA-methyltransferase (adenine-specific)
MLEDRISDGDTVIIRKQPTVDNGETAVAVLNGNEVTLKKIFKEKNGFRLQPANSSLKPFFVKELEIRGKVISVIRKFDELKKEVVEEKKNKKLDYRHNNTPASHRGYIHKTNFKFIENNISTVILNKLKSDKILDDYFWDKDFLLINGDCIKIMKSLVDCGVKFDHIITDIPYGTVNGLSIEGWKTKGNIPDWDSPLNIGDMLQNCFNISRTNANLLLFAQEPMTNDLINGANYYQKYTLSNKMIWAKNNHANGFSAKTTPVNYYEEILLFRKNLDETNSIKIRKYFKDILDYIGKTKKEIMEETNQGLDHCFRYANRTFYIPTFKNYDILIEKYGINKMPNFISYEQLKNAWDKENKTVFNLPEDKNIVKNIFEVKKDTNNIHPTQKPQKLLEQLIALFSNKNDSILDFTAGSGSTGIASIKLNRKFIGIELDKHFYSEAIRWYKLCN